VSSPAPGPWRLPVERGTPLDTTYAADRFNGFNRWRPVRCRALAAPSDRQIEDLTSIYAPGGRSRDGANA
jgi:hypothetical protein